jgi:hypothetical protein
MRMRISAPVRSGYTQTDNEELVPAQNMMLDAIFNMNTGVVQ